MRLLSIAREIANQKKPFRIQLSKEKTFDRDDAQMLINLYNHKTHFKGVTDMAISGNSKINISTKNKELSKSTSCGKIKKKKYKKK